jgi:hypothetical protein
MVKFVCRFSLTAPNIFVTKERVLFQHLLTRQCIHSFVRILLEFENVGTVTYKPLLVNPPLGQMLCDMFHS